ncbi:MAG: 50S ribosomal protein L29 [Bacteroidota bacterium]
MPSKKFLELKEFDDEGLANELLATEAAYQRLEFDHTIKGLDNPLELRETRRDIARLKTEIRRREIEKMTPEQVAGRSKIRARRRKA